MSTTRALATYEALLALPEDVKAEVIGGEVRLLPSPVRRHSQAADFLTVAIGGPFHHDHGRGGPGGWWIFTDTDVELARHDIVRPDLSGWRRERMPEPWAKGPARVAPDWICEVLSPSNRKHDEVTKRALYLKHGVAFYWMVDPSDRTLTSLRLENGRWVELGVWDDTAHVKVEPFDAVELEVGRCFPEAGTDAVHDGG